MQRVLNEILQECIKSESALAPLATRLIDLYRQSGVKGFTEMVVVPLLSAPPITGQPHSFCDNDIEDCRFKKLLLKGVRRYPAVGQNYYTLSFKQECAQRDDKICDSKPVSAIFLGNNGVGKSSLFNALEYACTGISSTALQRHVDSKKFMTNLQSKVEDSSIFIETCSNEIIVDGKTSFVSSCLPSSAYFCCEYDVEQLYKEIDSQYLAKQLGIGDFKLLLDLFEKIVNTDSLSEKRISFNSLNNQIVEAKLRLTLRDIIVEGDEDLFDSILSELSILCSNEKKKSKEIKLKCQETLNNLRILWNEHIIDDNYHISFQSLIDHFGLPIEIDSYSKIKSLNWTYLKRFTDSLISNKNIIQTLNDPKQGEIYDNDKKNIISECSYQLQEMITESPLLTLTTQQLKNSISFRNYLSSRYIEILDNFRSALLKIFIPLFKSYLNDDIQEFKFIRDNYNIRIELVPREIFSKEGKGSKEGNVTSPKDYLNTFRFKIYCVALKLSLALTCSVIYRLNPPFVMDDIFDSSDFPNRENIRSFIGQIFRDAPKFLAEHDVKAPFQLIFFTQDDVIADSVYRGVCDEEDIENVKFSRIFDIKQNIDSDKSEESYKKLGNITSIKIEDYIC